jgi:hypothetical protein
MTRRRRLLSNTEIAALAKEAGTTVAEFRRSMAVYTRDARYGPEFPEAFRMVTREESTPLAVAAALKDPKLMQEIEHAIDAIREQVRK